MSATQLVNRATLTENQVALSSKRLNVLVPESVTASNAAITTITGVTIRKNDFGSQVRLTRSTNVYTFFIPISEIGSQISARVTVDSNLNTIKGQRYTVSIGTSGQDRTVVVTTFNNITATALPINVEIIAFV